MHILSNVFLHLFNAQYSYQLVKLNTQTSQITLKSAALARPGLEALPRHPLTVGFFKLNEDNS